MPAEHLLDFHDFIHWLEIIHEDIQINLFRYSFKGLSLDWCRSLPTASINSLKGFHDAFNLLFKDKFLNDALFLECCHEYNLFHQINGHEKYGCAEKSMVEEDTFHKDQVISFEISDD